ncbi:glucose-6-phosphate isomerase [Pseudoclavibacter soli]|uniref:glucose-6-phosphate isomerase n=1 Tax=Pseudoclavibacter soli TaxID=452623 RepID=UPI000411D697|nr:glucose-6-phosphate isomerase [Pseudoclavibacter soli]
MSTITVTIPDRRVSASAQALQRLIESSFASRLWSGDDTIWGAEAQPEASIRLGWLRAAEISAPLVPEILALRDALAERGVDRFVLAGMGGSSLAPELITQAAGVRLHILDTTDPQQLRAVIEHDLDRTAVVVSSKSGSTLETDSQRRAYEQAFREAGIDPAERIIVVTDPGSPLDENARAAGYRVFNADANVGGRYSALTAFGLVPSGLAGVDIVTLLDEARAASAELVADSVDNPALRLAATLAADPAQVDKFAVAAGDGKLAQLPAWIEQLVAESTGKQGVGVLPIAVRVHSPEITSPTADVQPVLVGTSFEPLAEYSLSGALSVVAPLGAQLLVWEVATAALGALLEINPFDQPDVESAKAAARALLEHPLDDAKPAYTEAGVRVYAPGAQPDLHAVSSLTGALEALFATLDPELGYLAVQIYADRLGHNALEQVRDEFAQALNRPVTFGWGPRFLHSTGQYHKGGPAEGVFLQITRVSDDALAIPDRPFGFAQLLRAQATGDAQVLADHGLPVLRIEIDDDAHLQQVLQTAVSVAGRQVGEA